MEDKYLSIQRFSLMPHEKQAIVNDPGKGGLPLVDEKLLIHALIEWWWLRVDSE
ncbi:MAG: hypothetical protein ACYSSN_09825 [Planctomycetota bacterium]|jgi:hypothetical protein